MHNAYSLFSQISCLYSVLKCYALVQFRTSMPIHLPPSVTRAEQTAW